MSPPPPLLTFHSPKNVSLFGKKKTSQPSPPSHYSVYPTPHDPSFHKPYCRTLKEPRVPSSILSFKITSFLVFFFSLLHKERFNFSFFFFFSATLTKLKFDRRHQPFLSSSSYLLKRMFLLIFLFTFFKI